MHSIRKKIKAFKDKKKETFIFIRELSPEQKIVPPGTPDFSFNYSSAL